MTSGRTITETADDPATVDGAVAMLRSTSTIRTRAAGLLDDARSGHSRWFGVDDDALDAAAEIVADVTRSRYPTLEVPFHSRWRHFEVGSVDRVAWLTDRAGPRTPPERIRMMIDLAVVSVLLDAGAGPAWHFDENTTGRRLSRSEGLAVASLHAFADGAFSGDADDPFRVDAAGLRALSADRLAAAFQVDTHNPLVGLDGRMHLLHTLAVVLADRPAVFGTDGRPGCLADALLDADQTTGRGPAAPGVTVRAHDILSLLLENLSSIWPSPAMIGGQPLGDCWHHDAVTGSGLTAGWMPFHKLSQWLTYSLLEPFGDGGVTVTGLDDLTALPEYRNGGLLIDTGVLQPLSSGWSETAWRVDDEFIVEWRALTVALLDELAPAVCVRLGLDPTTTPLACVLEGGTWAAGRQLAAARDGLPPLHIVSDGTVF